MLFSRQLVFDLLWRGSSDLLVCAGSGSFLRPARGPQQSSLAAAQIDSGQDHPSLRSSSFLDSPGGELQLGRVLGEEGRRRGNPNPNQPASSVFGGNGARGSARSSGVSFVQTEEVENRLVEEAEAADVDDAAAALADACCGPRVRGAPATRRWRETPRGSPVRRQVVVGHAATPPAPDTSTAKPAGAVEVPGAGVVAEPAAPAQPGAPATPQSPAATPQSTPAATPEFVVAASTPRPAAKPTSEKPSSCGGGGETGTTQGPPVVVSTVATTVTVATAAPDVTPTTAAPPPPAPTPTSSSSPAAAQPPKPKPKPNVDHLPWEDGSLTAYWDCSTMGWMCNNQPASQRQQPYVPTDAERTKEYGEDLWITGAASDSMRDRGPGKKCYLIRGVEPNPDFRVIAMLTNSCPGNSNPGCQRPKVHIDVAAPGWDNHKFSASQHCGEPGKIGQKESGAINNWIMNPDDPGWQTGNPPGQLTWAGWSRPKEERTTFFTDRCKELKNGYDQGCLNFVKWGWKQGDPQAKFVNIPCPQAWVQKTGCPDR